MVEFGSGAPRRDNWPGLRKSYILLGLVMNYNGSISLITISGVWAWVYQFPSHNMHKSKTQKYSLDIGRANEGTGEEVANVTE